MRKLKKILHIAPTPFFSDRGCHIRIAGVVKSLEELGYDNIVSTYHHGRDVDGIETKRIAPIRAYTQIEAGPSKHKLLADWRLLWLVVREMRRTKPDALHAHLHEGLMIGLVAKVLSFWRYTPLVGDMQGSLFGELEAHGTFNKRPWLKMPVHAIEYVLLRSARVITCSSTHSREKFIANFKLRADKVFLVQDGAYAAEPLDAERITVLKKTNEVPDDKIIAIYTGALLDAKGLDMLKDVILRSKAAGNLHFLIIGYPTENLTPFLVEYGLMDICTLTGQVPFEYLKNYLNMADIAIDAKASEAGEGSGKMLNYLACGLPVIAFDTKNNRDFLPEGTQLAASSGDMAEQLQLWAQDPGLRVRIGANNLRHFTNEYSWQQTVRQLCGIYDNLLEQSFALNCKSADIPTKQ